MEPRTIGKAIGAFLAGAFLALGGAILYSRQTGVTSAIHPPTVSTSSVALAPVPEVQGQAAAQQQTADETAEASPPPKPGETQTSFPARRRRTAVVTPAKSPERPPQLATFRAYPTGPQAAETSAPGSVAAGSPAPVPVQNGTLNSAPPPPGASVRPNARNTAAQSPVAREEPHVVTLPAGTTLTVRLGETLSTERNSDGDTFQGTLDAPVVADGFIIAERRSRIVGHVVQANPAGRVKGLANISLAVSEINTTDGQRVAIDTDSYEKWGNSSVKSDTAKVAGGAALGAIIGAIAGGGRGAAIGAGAGGAAGTGVALGTRGAAVSVPSESILTFRLARPVTITEKFN